MWEDSQAVAKSKSAGTPAPGSSRRQLLPRAKRREQILRAAAQAFSQNGFAATSLEDVAAEAGVDRVILYRHFESKADLYRAVLRRASERLTAATGAPKFTESSVAGLLAAAADDPAGFRLLFHHAAREPEFRQDMDVMRRQMVAVTRRALAGRIRDPAWARWASNLLPTISVEAVIAWLDAGQPDGTKAAQRIEKALWGVIEAAQAKPGG
jgi:AcrR family transcriptional regulator